MTDMLLQSITSTAIDPAMAMLPPGFDSPRARVLMLAIGLQESGFCDRCQVLPDGGRGPAHSFWQMERGGGVKGVLQHPQSQRFAIQVCDARSVAPEPQAVWERIETDDVLAAVFARLLIYTDPMVLPAETEVMAAWRLYAFRLWRPGKPHPETWPANHQRAREFVLHGG